MVFHSSFTIRTARSRTSGEYLVEVPVLLMAPSSQTSEPPANPGRFTYDIADQKRWRRVWKVMNGYGEWLQLSVFQCRLSRKRLVQLRGALAEAIHDGADHVLILDLGPADTLKPRMESLGKVVEAVERKPIIV